MKMNMKTILASLVVLMVTAAGCSKKTDTSTPPPGGGGSTPPGGATTDSVYNPTDPAVASTIGFFLNTWQGKTFTAPATVAGTVATGSATDNLTINVNKVITKTPVYIYGNNSNLWTGQYVTNASLVGYIKDLAPGIIRAPAGSVSDIYFWNGVDTANAPADAPAQIYSNGSVAPAGYWYGGNTASWTFSLANYYNLLSQTNSTGIITINYGYARYGTSANPVAAAAHLAADWVRHDNGRTKFWEIGNETYGNWEAGYQIDQSQNKDGQPAIITGDLYGRHVQVFVDSMRVAATQIGATIYIGASLVDAPPYNGAYATLQTWNQGVIAQASAKVDYFIVHDYFTAYNANSTVSDILSTGTTVPASGMSYVKSQLAAAGVAQKPVALTEWNIQAVGSKQDISYVAGIHAAKTLGAIIKNQFGEASRWDLMNAWGNSAPAVNGDDQGLFSWGQPGIPDGNPRPAFFYMYYFQKFFGDRMVSDSLVSFNSDLTTYSSTFSSGQAGTVIINSGTLNHIVSIDFQHFPAGSKYYWYLLTGGTDNGSFSGQVFVNGTGPANGAGGPLNYPTLSAYSAPLTGTIKITVPPLSVIYLIADKK
jgi:hypothetical protein